MWISYQFVEFTNFFFTFSVGCKDCILTWSGRSTWWAYFPADITNQLDQLAPSAVNHIGPDQNPRPSSRRCWQILAILAIYRCFLLLRMNISSYLSWNATGYIMNQQASHHPADRINHLTPWGRHGRLCKSFTSVDHSPAKNPVLYSRKMFMFGSWKTRKAWLCIYI